MGTDQAEQNPEPRQGRHPVPNCFATTKFRMSLLTRLRRVFHFLPSSFPLLARRGLNDVAATRLERWPGRMDENRLLPAAKHSVIIPKARRLDPTKTILSRLK